MQKKILFEQRARYVLTLARSGNILYPVSLSSTGLVLFSRWRSGAGTHSIYIRTVFS